jgi:hypothetical protein
MRTRALLTDESSDQLFRDYSEFSPAQAQCCAALTEPADPSARAVDDRCRAGVVPAELATAATSAEQGPAAWDRAALDWAASAHANATERRLRVSSSAIVRVVESDHRSRHEQ